MSATMMLAAEPDPELTVKFAGLQCTLYFVSSKHTSFCLLSRRMMVLLHHHQQLGSALIHIGDNRARLGLALPVLVIYADDKHS